MRLKCYRSVHSQSRSLLYASWNSCSQSLCCVLNSCTVFLNIALSIISRKGYKGEMDKVVAVINKWVCIVHTIGQGREKITSGRNKGSTWSLQFWSHWRQWLLTAIATSAFWSLLVWQKLTMLTCWEDNTVYVSLLFLPFVHALFFCRKRVWVHGLEVRSGIDCQVFSLNDPFEGYLRHKVFVWVFGFYFWSKERNPVKLSAECLGVNW